MSASTSFSSCPGLTRASRLGEQCFLIEMAGTSPAMTSDTGFNLSNSQASFLFLPRLRGRVREGAKQPSGIGPCSCQATGPPVFVSPGGTGESSPGKWARGSVPPEKCPRERSADRRINNSTLARRGARLAINALASRRSTAAILAAGTARSRPGRAFRPPDPAGFRRRSSGGDLPNMASPLSRAGQHPEAPGDGLRDHPQAPPRSANQDASRWRPRMSRRKQDTERFWEYSRHAWDMRG